MSDFESSDPQSTSPRAYVPEYHIILWGPIFYTLQGVLLGRKIFTVLAPPEPQGILDSLAFELGFDIPGLLQISELGSGVFWCYRYGALEQYGSFRK